MDLSVKAMDCHALASKARNDRKSGFFTQDSRVCGGAVDFYRLQRILGFSKETSLRLFCDDFEGCRVQSKGAYLVYVTAALRDDSLKTSDSGARRSRSRFL